MPPVPEPTATKIRKGVRSSRINYESPQPNDALTLPSDMSIGAKAVWRHTVKAMKGTGVLTSADTEALRTYCEITARLNSWNAMLGGSTPLLTVSRRRGEVVRNPLIAICRDLADQKRLWSRELGLTPSARASLRIDSTAAMAEMDDIIGPPPRLRAIS